MPGFLTLFWGEQQSRAGVRRRRVRPVEPCSGTGSRSAPPARRAIGDDGRYGIPHRSALWTGGWHPCAQPLARPAIHAPGQPPSASCVLERWHYMGLLSGKSTGFSAEGGRGPSSKEEASRSTGGSQWGGREGGCLECKNKTVRCGRIGRSGGEGGGWPPAWAGGRNWAGWRIVASCEGRHQVGDARPGQAAWASRGWRRGR